MAYVIGGFAAAVQQLVSDAAPVRKSRVVSPSFVPTGGAGVPGAVGQGRPVCPQPPGGAQSPPGGPYHQKDVVQNANWEAGTRKNTGRKKTRRRIGGVHLP